MSAPRRYLVAGNETEPIRIEVCCHGGYVDPGRYRTLREAEAEAEALVDAGWRGVAITELGALHAAWQMCKTVVRAHTIPSGRYWPTHYCGRHDLLDDDRCPEHSFTPERAAWIRANAWTPGMREIDGSYPNGRGCFLYRISPCEMQRCGACEMGRCDLCICREEGGEDRWPARWDAHVTLDGRIVAHLCAVERQRCGGWVCTCDCRHTEPSHAGESLAADPPAAPAPATVRRAARRAPIVGQLCFGFEELS